MKKYILSLALVTAMVSCNDGSNTNSAGGEQQNPSAIDTTEHANGVTTGSVISTDTAAMRVPDTGAHK